MRKLIFIILLTSFVIQFELLANDCCSCSFHLSGYRSNQSATNDQQLADNEKTLSVMSSVQSLLSRVKAMGFLSQSKIDHLLDDMEHLAHQRNTKAKDESYQQMLISWGQFIDRLAIKLDVYESMSNEDKKKYFNKMSLPLGFITSHFVTFLETKSLKFKYQRMNTILKAMNQMEESSDLIRYLYVFEKQILKYFSIHEFLNCKA